MSSISALGSSQYSSPLQQLEAELQSEVSDGTISSSDDSALSSALTNIDSSLTAGQSSQAAGSADSGDAGPGDIKSKINSLIQAQVASGALTSDQATELQNLFNNTFGHGSDGPGGPGGHGGPGGPGGPQGGPPPGPAPSGGGSSGSASALEQLLDSASSTSSDTSGDSSSTDSSSSGNVLQDFLKQLQDAQSFAYGANGTSASNAAASTLVNYQA
jgi:hypothetical protein